MTGFSKITENLKLREEAEIEADVAQRNALRRDANLPELDVDHEIAREKFHDNLQIFNYIVNLYKDDYLRIRSEILQEKRLQYGENWGQSGGGNWALAHLTRERFLDFLATKGIVQPKHP